MIARLLSRLVDLRDARQLARTVHVQQDQLDALQTLAAHLAEQLEIAETAAEEYRARLAETTAPYTPGIEHSTAEIGEGLYRSWEASAAHGGEPVEPPRDAQSLENRVLSLTEGWRADRERTIAQQLTAAEVELADLRSKVEQQRTALAGMAARGYAAHEALSAAGVPFPHGATVEARIGLLVTQRREAEQGWSAASAWVEELRSKLAEERAAHDMAREGFRIVDEGHHEAVQERDEAQDRADRLQRHARALARAARWMRGALLDCDDVTFTILRAMAKGAKARLARIEADRDTRDDAPPPPTTRSPRAPAPPSPPRFRVTAGGDR